MRFAGELALIGAAGSGAALAADQLVHDEMDRLAQGSKDFRAAVAAQPEELAMAYEQVFSRGEMSMMDRVVVAGILDGQMLPADGEVQADSPAGKKGIELAIQIRQARPDLAASLATLAAKDIDLMARQSRQGVTTMDVISAGEVFQGYDKPKRTPGDSKELAVLVKDDGEDRIVRFGDPSMQNYRNGPDGRGGHGDEQRRAGFKDRHNCDEKIDKTTPGYWSCNWSR